MRPLIFNTEKSTTLKKRKRIEVKNISNNFTTKKFLIELWQLVFFSSISTLLIFIYLNQAWEPINLEQIEMLGLSGISKNDLDKAVSQFLSKNLLELNPKEIENHLLKKLPINGVSVNRRFFPPGIQLSIIERDPVAFASRITSNEIEKGMIDIEGNWIPLKFVAQSKKNNTTIFVENWNKSKRYDIKQIIKNRFILKSSLKKIKINSLQEMSIETSYFDSVLLGSNTDRLMEQINKLNQLQKSLPNLLINTKVKIVDLKDPTKPELKTEKIPNGDE
tara:strand:+ start:4095 stop:4925 length:831 start_codon:yes stop_codon:yes gene_type:complete